MSKTVDKILDILKIIGVIVAAVFGIIGISKLKNLFDSDADDPVSDDEIKPGTTVVKPGTIDPNSGNPFDDNYTVETSDGDKVDTPIPDDKIDKYIDHDLEGTEFKPTHDNTTDSLLDKIRKMKKKRNSQ